MNLYRNHEQYADPTAGAALARIAYDERLARRKIKQAKRRKNVTKAPACRKAPASTPRRKQHKPTHWRKAWPEPFNHQIPDAMSAPVRGQQNATMMGVLD